MFFHSNKGMIVKECWPVFQVHIWCHPQSAAGVSSGYKSVSHQCHYTGHGEHLFTGVHVCAHAPARHVLQGGKWEGRRSGEGS